MWRKSTHTWLFFMIADELLENAWTQCLTVQTNFYAKNGPQQHLQSWHPQQHMPTSCNQNTGLRPAIRPSREKTTSASTWSSLLLSIIFIQLVEPACNRLYDDTTDSTSRRWCQMWQKKELLVYNYKLVDLNQSIISAGKTIKHLQVGVNKIRHC